MHRLGGPAPAVAGALVVATVLLAIAAGVVACAPADDAASASADGEPPPRSSGVAGTPVLVTNLDAANFDAWAEHIAPDADELAFEAIPWIPSFAEGLDAAAEQGKPLLVWGMNGHPLGCT